MRSTRVRTPDSADELGQAIERVAVRGSGRGFLDHGRPRLADFRASRCAFRAAFAARRCAVVTTCGVGSPCRLKRGPPLASPVA